MTGSELRRIVGLCLFLMTFMLISAFGSGNNDAISDKGLDLRAMEEEGVDQISIMNPAVTGNIISKIPPVINTIPQDSVLLIPNSTNDDVGMYDPFDGTFLGILIPSDTAHLSTPINAIQGADGNIYVSDQIEDGVQVYDTTGAWLYTYCDRYDSLNGLGLDNVRGIDFRNDTLFVTCGGTRDLVAMFDAPHNRLTDFINDGSDPFDIMFLDDGRSLLCDMGGAPDNVRLYDIDGTFISTIITCNFPEQVQFDDLAPGAYLNAAFSSNEVYDFDLDGTVYQTITFSGGRGAYRLGNGNILATNGSGVHEIDPGTGGIIETENTGQARFIELYVRESGPAPTGRCCYNNYQDCVDTSQAACTALNGMWNGGLNCTDDPCPAVGRCCYNNNQDCVDVIESECTALGGNWDENLNCTDNPCTTGGCDYVPGDVNGSTNYNGLDITYGVAFFKGGPAPQCPDCPPCNSWNYCGDVNGSCNYNGLDITYGVAYFKGGPAPVYCVDCPPNP